VIKSFQAYGYRLHTHTHIVVDTTPVSAIGGKLLRCFRCLNFHCLSLFFGCHNFLSAVTDYRCAGVGDADVVLVVVVVTVVVLVVLVVTVVVTVVTDVFTVDSGDVGGTNAVYTPNEAVEEVGGDVKFNVTLLQLVTVGIRYEPNKPA